MLRRRRPPGAGGVRRPGRGRAAAASGSAEQAAAGGPARRGRPDCAPRCSPRSATTCAPRSPRPRPRSTACAARTSQFSDADRDELLATADESLDRLTRLVDNLLDMSRLQAGALGVHPAPIGVDDARARGPRRARTRQPRGAAAHARRPPRGVRRPGPARTHPGQPARQRPAPQPRRPAAARHRQRPGGQVEIRVVDHGPGMPAADWERIFLPFQRLGDRDNTPASAWASPCRAAWPRPWAARWSPDNTPGGGLTMVLSLTAAARSGAPAATRRWSTG